MRPLILGMVLSVVVGAAPAALAATAVVPVIHAASARYSADHRAIIVRASVDLPNACWSRPRLKPPQAGGQPDVDGVIVITAVAHSAEGPGLACPMLYRPNVPMPTLRWRGFPRAGLKAVRIVGDRTPITVPLDAPPD